MRLMSQNSLFTRTKIEIRKSGLITEISVKKIVHLIFFNYSKTSFIGISEPHLSGHFVSPPATTPCT